MDRSLDFEYIIIGAGPAGLQLGYYFECSNYDYLILESATNAGAFFEKMPRHRKLLSINKVHTGYVDREINLRWDWNSLLTDDNHSRFSHYSEQYFPKADQYVEYLNDFSKRYNLNIRYQSRIANISCKEKRFSLVDDHENIYHCDYLIVATGLGCSYLPRIRGIHLAENYDKVSIDPNNFHNQRILIIGKGNSGFETADNIIDSAAVIHIASPSPVKFAWNTHHVGNLRSVNNDFMDTYLLKAQNGVLEVDIEEIARTAEGDFEVSVKYKRAKDSTAQYRYDRIIACTGFRFDTDIFDDSCRPYTIIDGRLPKMNYRWESENIPNLYFGGTLMQARDFKKTSSGFIHGFRYNIRALFRIFEKRNHGRSWPAININSWPNQAVEKIIDRINQSSGLWLQSGFLSDVIESPTRCTPGCYFEDVPVDYALSPEFTDTTLSIYVITLEYGKSDFDPLKDNRISHTDVEHADESTALHPVIRQYQKGCIIREHHIVENLEAIWQDENLHLKPLIKFFAES